MPALLRLQEPENGARPGRFQRKALKLEQSFWAINYIAYQSLAMKQSCKSGAYQQRQLAGVVTEAVLDAEELPDKLVA